MKLKDLLESSANEFDLADMVGMNSKIRKSLVSDAYPYSLNYKGKEFFNKIYLDQIIPVAEKALGLDNNIGQESYLGYLPEKDLFISGWDTWEDDDGVIPENVVTIKIDDNGKAHALQGSYDPLKLPNIGGLMYDHNGGYKLLHTMFQDLVDIRLD